MSESKKYKFITRIGLDGLVSAVLMKELGLIDRIKFVHPKDVQDGKIPVTDNDIIAGLPYQKAAFLVFDNHISEIFRNQNIESNHIIRPDLASSSRVIYDYYGKDRKFPALFAEMVDAVDKIIQANFTQEDILYPKKWVLLNFIIDPRTGLEKQKKFKCTYEELVVKLIDYAKDHSIDDILKLEEVEERAKVYAENQEKFQQQITACSKDYEQIVVFDTRKEANLYPGNRFMIYSMYPKSHISIHIFWGMNKQNTVFSVGKSVFKKQTPVNIAEIVYAYGGGGHEGIGTFQIANDKAETVLKELLEKLKVVS